MRLVALCLRPRDGEPEGMTTNLLLLIVLLLLPAMATATAVCVLRDCRPGSQPPPLSTRPLNPSGWSNW